MNAQAFLCTFQMVLCEKTKFSLHFLNTYHLMLGGGQEFLFWFW